MAKVVVDKLEDIPEALRTEYEPGPGGKLFLKIDGLGPEVDHPAVKELREAHARSKAERTKALEDAKKLASDMETMRAEMTKRLEEANPQAQIDGLRKSYEEREATKLSQTKQAYEAEIGKLSGALREVLVTKEAQRIALSLAADEKFAPHFMAAIAPRLVVEYGQDGKASTRVLDRGGQPSALTLENLREEIAQDPSFAPLLKGNQATGGGAVGASGGGGASAGKIDLIKATMAEKIAYYEKRNRINTH
jgi:hypothetical protein